MLYKELQPVDAYIIKLSHPFSDYDRQLLTLFYQPLIGPQAMSLFLTMWADAEREEGKVYNHYRLMQFLSLPLGPVFEARIALEAIGLLRTYQKREGDSRHFMYELVPPLDAKTFLTDPLLSTFLFSKIGEQAYRDLRSRYAIDTDQESGFQEISRTFLDVFTPSQLGQSAKNAEGGQFKGRSEPAGLTFGETDFDFQLLRSGLSEQMVPQSALAAVSKELIAKLAFLYSLTPIDMQKVVMIALDEDLNLPEERLRKAASDYYKMNVSKQPPVLQKVFAKPPADDPKDQVLSREDEYARHLESTAPIDMLREINNGKEPLPVDVQLAERLVTAHGLPVGVVNVLLQYILLRNDGKITNSFAERIASHWQAKKIGTAKAAMEISRQEHDQYMKWLNQGKKPVTASRKPTREEKVPEWFYNKDEKNKKTPPAANPNIDEERRKLLKELGASGKEVK